MAIKTLLVVGSGPGGYAAALKAAARGLSVTLVEDQPIGGACVNRGCIPSKFLLSKAKQLSDGLRLRESGISMRLETIDLSEVLRQKSQVVDTLRQRILQAIKAARITFIQGRARFKTSHEMTADLPDGSTQTVSADAVLLATGSSPVVPALFPSHPAILTSTSIFNLSYLPAHLVVIGGGYIGSELACAFQGLGSKVTLIEKESRLMATQPEFEAAAGVIQRAFEKRGMTVWTQTTVDGVNPIDDTHVEIKCSNGEVLEANAVLLALGRAPNLDFDLANAGIALDGRRLPVSALGQTSVPHIYAIGDVVSPVPLAHTATAEGERVIDALLGEKTDALDYSTVPRCVYTWPEAAAVGRTDAQARDAGFTPRIDRYHFAASAKAMTEGETEGFWVVVSDTASGKILGAQVVGSHATELIHLFALALKANLTLKDISQTIFAHPTLSEGFSEVAKRAVRTATTRMPGNT